MMFLIVQLFLNLFQFLLLIVFIYCSVITLSLCNSLPFLEADALFPFELVETLPILFSLVASLDIGPVVFH